MLKKRPPRDRDRTAYTILLCGNTVLLFVIYRVLIAYGEMTDKTIFSFVTMVVYLALLLGFSLAYVIYNRFFWRWGVTADRLPEAWSAVQKQQFLDLTAARRERSKWLLLIIFPLIITFLFDAFDLFLLDGVLNHVL